jgi:hypothetical protein
VRRRRRRRRWLHGARALSGWLLFFDGMVLLLLLLLALVLCASARCHRENAMTEKRRWKERELVRTAPLLLFGRRHGAAVM